MRAHRSLAAALARLGSAMSRSVHENRSRRRLAQLGCIDWPQVGKKHRMKSGVRRTRKAGARNVVPAVGGEPKVTIEHEHDVVFFPVSSEVVRQVIGLLPPGAIDGLRSVRLEAGLRYVNQHADPGDEPDPLLGRRGFEIFPGVYAPSIRGTYSVKSGDIRVFCYVKSTTLVLTPRQEADVRRAILRTLVHEVAHHYDRVNRVARDRWRMDNVAKVERYAEGLAERWCAQVVTPYLEAIYAKQW